MQQPEHPKPSPSRPSLLSPTGAGDLGHTRILGSVRASSEAAAKPKKKWLALLFLGLGMLAVAWGLLNRPSQTSPDKAPVSTSAPAPLPLPHVAVTASEAIASTDTTPAAPLAATITDTPPSSTPVIPKDDANALSKVLEAGVEVPPDTLKSALIAKPAPPPPAKPKPYAIRAETGKTAPERSLPSSPAVAAKASPSDHDVDLISALVAHSGGQSEPKSPPSPKKSVAYSSSPDIVERHRGDSTAALLKRCKRLGGTEAKLCSRRICTGHESDAVCKAK